MPRRKKQEYAEDDGRTIVPMNVDGMPWYTRGVDSSSEERASSPSPRKPEMSKDEARGYTWAAVKAGLLIGAVFAVAFTLFLLFCDFVWFR